MAELECGTIRGQQRYDIAIAKVTGKYKGRQSIPVDLTALQMECKL
ncbi:MAG: hypothetical protein K2O52_04545 [Oscillospiraceae bacterium]|nr:hypothetical protein [Oscillospiraceae bacterium]